MIINFKIKKRTLIFELLFPSILIVAALLIPIYYEINNIISRNSILDSFSLLLLLFLLVYFTIFIKIRIVINHYKLNKNKIIIINTEKEVIEIIEDKKNDLIYFSNISLIYEYYSSGTGIQSYYKLILNKPLASGKDKVFISYLTISNLEKYLKNIDFKKKRCLYVFIPKK